MTATRYLLRTSAGMYRAAPGNPYPWTEDKANAHRYRSRTAANEALRDHAAFTARPFTDYEIIDAEHYGDERLTDTATEAGQ